MSDGRAGPYAPGRIIYFGSYIRPTAANNYLFFGSYPGVSRVYRVDRSVMARNACFATFCPFEYGGSHPHIHTSTHTSTHTHTHTHTHTLHTHTHRPTHNKCGPAGMEIHCCCRRNNQKFCEIFIRHHESCVFTAKSYV